MSRTPTKEHSVSMGNAYRVWMCDDCDRQIHSGTDVTMTCNCGATYHAETGKRMHPDDLSAAHALCGLCYPDATNSGPWDLCPPHAAKFRAWLAAEES